MKLAKKFGKECKGSILYRYNFEFRALFQSSLFGQRTKRNVAGKFKFLSFSVSLSLFTRVSLNYFKRRLGERKVAASETKYIIIFRNTKEYPCRARIHRIRFLPFRFVTQLCCQILIRCNVSLCPGSLYQSRMGRRGVVDPSS